MFVALVDSEVIGTVVLVEFANDDVVSVKVGIFSAELEEVEVEVGPSVVEEGSAVVVAGSVVELDSADVVDVVTSVDSARSGLTAPVR